MNLNCIYCMKIMVSKNIIHLFDEQNWRKKMIYNSTILTKFNELQIYIKLKKSNHHVRTKLHKKVPNFTLFELWERNPTSTLKRKKSIQKAHKNSIKRMKFYKEEKNMYHGSAITFQLSFYSNLQNSKQIWWQHWETKKLIAAMNPMINLIFRH